MRSKEIAYTPYEHHGQEVYLLAFEYDEATIALIKQTLAGLRNLYTSRTGQPSTYGNGWKPLLHNWIVSQVIWPEFQSALRKKGYSFQYYEGDYEPEVEPDNSYSRGDSSHQHQARPAKPSPPNIFKDWLNLDTSNALLLRSTYRDIASLVHPDKQPNERLQALGSEFMKRLNHDYEQVRKAS